MAFAAKMVLDSISPFDVRLCTIEATYPRFVHAEVLTHRDRERNSASSRAIPWMSWRPKFKAESEAEYAMNKAAGGIDMLHDKCMKKMILTDPVVPLKFGMEQRGMQKGEDIPPHLAHLAEKLWLMGRDYMVDIADMLHNIGETYMRIQRGELESFGLFAAGPEHHANCEDVKIHKSLANRLTEPWMWITVVMTATEWNNFFRLRCHPAAEQHFFKIACMIRDVIRESKPRRLNFGEIHAPYVTEEEKAEIIDKQVKSGYFNTDKTKWDHPDGIIQAISTGRCARVSYLTHDGKRDFKKDIELYETLLRPPGDPDEDIMHASPFGHVAKPAERHHRSGPFIGWKQFRKEFANENVPGCTV
jgi:hypothetical protein